MFTHILDLTTRAEVIFEDVGHAHVSNDGSRIVALNAAGMPCVAQLGGGPCVAVGRVDQSYVGTHAAGAHWSPDDEWILFRGLFEGGASLVDPDGQDLPQPSWIAGGAESIQRVAP
jgi:hypothetical protein